mgnify:CR=1 FL=1
MASIFDPSLMFVCHIQCPAHCNSWLPTHPTPTHMHTFAGILFALGLGAAGMTMPSKVSSFLSFLAGTFDPSLMFVMGGALLIATPGYQLIMRKKVLPHPILASAQGFNLPTSQTIDWKLLGGSAMFGMGWGAAGLCPGPAIVSLATLQVCCVCSQFTVVKIECSGQVSNVWHGLRCWPLPWPCDCQPGQPAGVR